MDGSPKNLNVDKVLSLVNGFDTLNWFNLLEFVLEKSLHLDEEDIHEEGVIVVNNVSNKDKGKKVMKEVFPDLVGDFHEPGIGSSKSLAHLDICFEENIIVVESK